MLELGGLPQKPISSVGAWGSTPKAVHRSEPGHTAQINATRYVITCYHINRYNNTSKLMNSHNYSHVSIHPYEEHVHQPHLSKASTMKAPLIGLGSWKSVGVSIHSAYLGTGSLAL